MWALYLFAWYPFTEIAHKGTRMMPAYCLAGAEEQNQMIAIPRYFFKVIKMGENWSAGHQVPEQVGCVSGHRGP